MTTEKQKADEEKNKTELRLPGRACLPAHRSHVEETCPCMTLGKRSRKLGRESERPGRRLC